MDERPILHGAPYSVYVRAVRLVLAEKGVSYDLRPVDVFAKEGLPAGYLDLHPFGRIPSFEHDGFCLYETGAITRYIDEAFEGPSLQPEGTQNRARVNQLLGILDAYVYRTIVWDIYVERISAPKEGRPSDEARIAAAVGRAATCFDAIEQIMATGPFLTGHRPTLADFHAAPMFAYFVQAPEAESLLAHRKQLSKWWEKISQRPSMAAT